MRGLVKLNLQKSKIDYTALNPTLYLLSDLNENTILSNFNTNFPIILFK